MRKVVMAGLAVALVTSFSAVALADGDGWTVDLEVAKKQAQADGKTILMEFTGSDWCPPCKALKANVFDTEVFKTEAPKSFALLKLDNPNDKSKQTEAEIAQYKELSTKYAIRGVPTVMLADEQGRPFAQFVGYGGDSPEDYLKKLNEGLTVRKTRDDFMAKAAKAEGVEKAKLLAQALEPIESAIVLTAYRDQVDQIVAADANNEAGLKDKFAGMIRSQEIKAKLDAMMQANAGKEPAEMIAAIDEFLRKESPEGEGLQQALYFKGAMQFRTDKEAAKGSLEAALKAAPETEMAGQIKQILARVFSAPENKDGDK